MVLTEVKDFTNDAEVGFEDLNNLEEEANDPYQLRQIDHLARVILDSVRCIPETDILQKQLLLPVFLAACESCSETDRVFIRQYCKHWSKVSRFYHFESAAAVLEDIWKDWSLSTRSVYWWGVKVGNGGLMGSGVEAQGTLAMELLLG
ncbi:hypothetical protein PLIIFM63780_003500 [Purpureocillium lilacinum]|nr:hypothetical protein PLIIFM63780_003500 [Purpureocillium lilacinum]